MASHPQKHNICDGLSPATVQPAAGHILDSSSFPVKSLKFPLLSGKGAYSPAATYPPAPCSPFQNHAHAVVAIMIAIVEAPLFTVPLPLLLCASPWMAVARRLSCWEGGGGGGLLVV